jgi:hypothetical protein
MPAAACNGSTIPSLALSLAFEGTGRGPIEPSLPLGASNDAVFGDWLGHSEEELAVYKAQDVIGGWQEQPLASFNK